MNIVRRPLTAFNDQPLLELSALCDVMIVDHPHISRAIRERAIVPIEDLVTEDEVSLVAERAVGRSQDSFVVDGITAAFACDAACHVSAFRPEKMEHLGVEPPSTWEEVFDLQDLHAASVAFALYPTDAISCLMSLIDGEGAAPIGGPALFPDNSVAVRAIEMLLRLAGRVDSSCWSLTPQDIFCEAQANGGFAYIPLTFGYSLRTKPENGGWRFAPPPRRCGSLLGGAGMAVSSKSPRKRQAADFVSWYCRDEGQLLAGRNGGQPSGLAAWEDDFANRENDDFFVRTRSTQESAFVRPLSAWWPAFQTEAGVALVEQMRRKEQPQGIVGSLEAIYSRYFDQAAKGQF